MNEPHSKRQPIPVIRELPPLRNIADACAREMDATIAYMRNTVELDQHVQSEVEKRSLSGNDLNASLCERLGTALGALEVAARRIEHLSGLLKEAK